MKAPLKIRLLVLALLWDFFVMSRLEIVLNWLDERCWISRPKVEGFLIGVTTGTGFCAALSLRHIPVWEKLLYVLISAVWAQLMWPLHKQPFEVRFLRRRSVIVALSRLFHQVCFGTIIAVQFIPPVKPADVFLASGWCAYLLFILVVDCVRLEPPKRRRAWSEIVGEFGIRIPQPETAV